MSGLSHHPAPQRSEARRGRLAFAVAGGPLAWIVQLGAGYAIFSLACYVGPERDAGPMAGSWTLAVVVYVDCLLVALAAAILSAMLFRRTRGEAEGSLIEHGHGRTRFVALWGMLLGFGFAAVILVNGIAMIGVTPCGL